MSYYCHCEFETLHNWPPESIQDMNGLWHHRETECESIAGVLRERVTLKARIAQLESALRAVLAAGSGLRPDDAKRRIDEWDEIAADARHALAKEGT